MTLFLAKFPNPRKVPVTEKMIFSIGVVLKVVLSLHRAERLERFKAKKQTGILHEIWGYFKIPEIQPGTNPLHHKLKFEEWKKKKQNPMSVLI